MHRDFEHDIGDMLMLAVGKMWSAERLSKLGEHTAMCRCLREAHSHLEEVLRLLAANAIAECRDE